MPSCLQEAAVKRDEYKKEFDVKLQRLRVLEAEATAMKADPSRDEQEYLKKASEVKQLAAETDRARRLKTYWMYVASGLTPGAIDRNPDIPTGISRVCALLGAYHLPYALSTPGSAMHEVLPL
jgi:hypothetical protein